MHWTTGQQAKWSILHQGHDSKQNSSREPRLPPAQYSIMVQDLGLKHIILWCIYISVLSSIEVPYNLHPNCHMLTDCMSWLLLKESVALSLWWPSAIDGAPKTEEELRSSGRWSEWWHWNKWPGSEDCGERFCHWVGVVTSPENCLVLYVVFYCKGFFGVFFFLSRAISGGICCTVVVCLPVGWAIKPAPGAWFMTTFISLAQVVPGPV